LKLKQLMEREKFPSIFNVTLGNYLSSKYDWHGEIIWNGESEENSSALLVNERVNIIFPSHLKPRDIRLFAREYTYHKKPFRRLAQSVYVYFSTSKTLRNFFASYALHINPYPDFLLNICILPGNHSIRIVNLDLNECLVLSKAGYRSDKLENSINFRALYSDLPGPKILDWDLLEGWYIEERIFGIPIDRLPKQNDQENALSEACLFLSKIHKKTLKRIDNSKWLEEKFSEIDLAISQLPECYNLSLKNQIISLKTHLIELSQKSFHSGHQIEVAMTHGDFQPANILSPSNQEERKVFIIDWEYAGLRCSHYDTFVYNLDARRPKGLANRIKKLIQNKNNLDPILGMAGLNNLHNNNVKSLVSSFLVDELLFRLDDTNIPNLKEPSEGLLFFMSEVKLMKFGKLTSG